MFGQDEKETYTVEETIPPSNYLNLPIRIRERHLTQDSYRSEYKVQAIGSHLRAVFRSENDTISIKIPFRHWRAEREYTRKLNDWSLYLERWADSFETDGTVVEENVEKRVIEIEISVMDDSILEEEYE